MTKPTGVLAWFAGNPIAANLLMLLIMLGGVLSFQQVEKEVVPKLSMQRIVIKDGYIPLPAKIVEKVLGKIK